MAGSCTATCRTIDPTATHATARCTPVEAEPHGYHWKSFITPVLTWNSAAATSTATHPLTVVREYPEQATRPLTKW